MIEIIFLMSNHQCTASQSQISDDSIHNFLSFQQQQKHNNKYVYVKIKTLKF